MTFKGLFRVGNLYGSTNSLGIISGNFELYTLKWRSADYFCMLKTSVSTSDSVGYTNRDVLYISIRFLLNNKMKFILTKKITQTNSTLMNKYTHSYNVST